MKTIVGTVKKDILSFTVGRDAEMDLELAEADCIGSAAHADTLVHLPRAVRPFGKKDSEKIKAELLRIMRSARKGSFRIKQADQDIHLAVERALTAKLGDLGARLHTCRSRNDQAALDIRLYTKERLAHLITDTAGLANALSGFAKKHARVPMVGRTHTQPAMPGSVGLWSAAYAESLLDDLSLIMTVYDLNNRSPLGSAAGYGVPFGIDRDLTARLLGMKGPVHNVLHASNTRGKCEAAVLSALGQIMISLSRFSSDLILYSTPEFGYFSLPGEYCTGSSIMPQKKNPDVLELVRARASSVQAGALNAASIVSSLPGGYSRDLQETKAPLMEGLKITGGCVKVLWSLVENIRVNKKALVSAFEPAVFATDRALEMAARGMSFRKAYDHVKKNPGSAGEFNPVEAMSKRKHTGGPLDLGIDELRSQLKSAKSFAGSELRNYHKCVSRLFGVPYPELSARKRKA
ncbi:MAG: argininosuccinate lyase [Kiritimatiellia bacterium]